MNSQSFDYYVDRCNKFESAARWFRAWCKYHDYLLTEATYYVSDHRFSSLLEKIQKAHDRLIDLVD